MASEDDQPEKDPRCEICSDAYGTRYVCAPCRADEANDGWSVGREASCAEIHQDAKPTPWNEIQKRWKPSKVELLVLEAFVNFPNHSLEEIAEKVGCTVSYVYVVHAKLFANPSSFE